MKYLLLDALKAGRYLGSGFIGLQRFDGSGTGSDQWESVELFSRPPELDEDHLLFEFDTAEQPLDCSQIKRVFVASEEAKEEHSTTFSMFSDLYPYIEIEVLESEVNALQHDLIPSDSIVIAPPTLSSLDPARMPAGLLAISRSLVDFSDCLPNGDLTLDLSNGFGLGVMEYLRTIVESDKLAAQWSALTEKIVYGYCESVSSMSSPIELSAGFIIENMRKVVQVEDDRNARVFDTYLAHIRDILDGMQTLNEMVDDRNDLTVRRAVVIAILCATTDDLQVIQNSYRLNREIVRIAVFLIGLRQSNSFFYGSLSKEGKGVVDQYFKATSKAIRSGEVKLGVDTVSRAHSYDREALVELEGLRVLSAPIAKSPGLKQVLAALSSGGYSANANKAGDPVVSRILGNGSQIEISLKITPSEANQKLIVETMDLDCGAIFRKSKVILDLVNLASDYGCAVSFNPKSKTLRLKRDQVIKTLDEPELTDHIKSIESAVLALKKALGE
ncbi:hypothetical protein A3750_12410 [Oleiphilus sp. HI0079]|uniref:hypothetical protein n=1 Tax=Oleiphilus sp. HI0079 TaxID=1822254 RepID=UPI0007C3D441|nr:hypothetical protein [Oleiphilus sp. HI0079]KZZ15076.1 hypothetical protein A3750_12410 [Oleiphilus sp. HI0079]